MRALILAVAVVAIITVGANVAHLLSNDEDSQSPVFAAVCDVAAETARGAGRAAASVFVDRAHEPLHELAASASDVGNRRAAARLLEAKNVVETAPEGPSLDAAEALVEATRAALDATGQPDPGQCP